MRPGGLGASGWYFEKYLILAPARPRAFHPALVRAKAFNCHLWLWAEPQLHHCFPQVVGLFPGASQPVPVEE